MEDDILCTNLSQTEQRSLVFHLLYAMDSFDYDISLEALTDNFGKGFGIIIPQESKVFQKAHGIIDSRGELDGLLAILLENWRLDRLGVPTKLILRLGLWELLNTTIDSVVVINEAVELAQCFAEKDAFKFINGILDRYVKQQEES